MSRRGSSRREGAEKAERKYNGEYEDFIADEYAEIWDYDMVFPVRKETEQLSERQQQLSLRNSVIAMREAGLLTKLFLSANRTVVHCKIRAPYERLLLEADRTGYTLMLDPERALVEASHERAHRGPIVIPGRSRVSKRHPFTHIYAPYDRKPHLQFLYKKHRPFGLLRSTDRLRLVHSILRAPRPMGGEDEAEGGPPGAGLDPIEMKAAGAITAFFPLHDQVVKSRLRAHWLTWCSLPWSQPLTAHPEDGAGVGVREYFGEKVAMYFAFLAHYTTWLIPAALIGIGVYANQLSEARQDVPLIAVYGVFVALWSIFLLETWKRRESTLAMEWGMADYKETEQQRPQFKGELIPSPVTGKPMKFFSPNLKALRIIMSSAVITTAVGCVVAAVVGLFFFRVFVTQLHHWPMGGELVGIANALTIQVANALYSLLARKLNEFENHPTDTAFEDALILKTFCFQFVNSYSSLFYIAFIKGRFAMLGQSTECDGNSCMGELSTQLGSIFGTMVLVNNVVEVLMPLVKKRLAMRKSMASVMHEDEDDDAAGQRGGAAAGATGAQARAASALGFVSGARAAAEDELDMGEYESTFEDMAEMAIQFGYCTMFVTAFPLAPLLALVNNYFEQRVDATKLTSELRRPVPHGAQNIGTWHTVLDIISRVAVVTNVALVVFTSNLLESESTETKLLVFLIAEHAVFMLQYFLSFIPDVPLDVKVQLQRQTYIVDKLIREVPDQDDAASVSAARERTEFPSEWFIISSGDN